jgi:hypothetical protein
MTAKCEKNSFLLEALLSFNLLYKRYNSAVECKFSYDACKVVHSVAHGDKNTHIQHKTQKETVYLLFFFSPYNRDPASS